MPCKKPFNDLSISQQSRRVSKEVQTLMEEFFSDESNDSDRIFGSCYEKMTSDRVETTSAYNIERNTSSETSTNFVENNDESQLFTSQRVLNNYETSMDQEEIPNIDNFSAFLSSINIDSNDEMTDSDTDYSDSDTNSSFSNESNISDDISNSDDNVNALGSDLLEWYTECGNIGSDSMTKLLHILRKAGHDDLPKDART